MVLRPFSLLLLLTLAFQSVASLAIYPNVAAAHVNTTTGPILRPKSRIWQHYYNCDHEQQVRIVEAVAATGQMYKKAHARTKALSEMLAQEPEVHRLSHVDRILLDTFQTMYGQVYFGDGAAENEGGRGRVKRIQDRLFALSEAFKYTAWPPVQFVCDIKHLVPLNPTPEELAAAPGIADHLYFDTRPADEGGQIDQWFEGEACEGAMAETVRVDAPKWGETTIVLLCKQGWYSWQREYNDFSESVSELTPERYAADVGEIHLRDVCEEIMACALVHEFTHSKVILGDDVTDDIAYDPEKDGEDDAADEDGYIEGFELVQYHVRTSPTDRAMKHADNTMYWVLAMYLDKWDWHTGFNLEIKKDKEKPHKHGSN